MSGAENQSDTCFEGDAIGLAQSKKSSPVR